jgi:hypothetical protein
MNWKEELNKQFFGGIPMEEMGTDQVDEKELQDFIQLLLDRKEHNAEVKTIEILHDYTRFLEKEGYTDSDTYSEKPVAVDRYLKSIKVAKTN